MLGSRVQQFGGNQGVDELAKLVKKWTVRMNSVLQDHRWINSETTEQGLVQQKGLLHIFGHVAQN